MNILRRLPLPRLLLVCGLVVLAGIVATAIASAVSSGPVPPAKPLAEAVHDAVAGPPVDGVSARVTLTDHLLEGAELAAGGGEGSGLLSSPLVGGGSGRLWVASDGRVRLELQAEKGDTQVIYDGRSISVYDASSNTLYRYTPKREGDSSTEPDPAHPRDRGVPSVSKIEEGIAHIREHADLSGATPADVAGQPAYTVRISPREGGSLIGGAELSFDADHGIPLRAAVYSSTSSSPVIELAASEISYGPVSSAIFDFSPPPNAKIEELAPSGDRHFRRPPSTAERPRLTTHGHDISAIGVLEARVRHPSAERGAPVEGLPTVDVAGARASELRTALGTILAFERSGVRYVVAGAVPTAAVEAVARGL